MRVSNMLLATVVALSFATNVSAHDNLLDDKPAEIRGAGNTPLCDNKTVINKVTKIFAKNNKKYWDSDLAFTEVENIRETGFLPNYEDENDRRFCAAHVHLTDGKHPTMYYLIQERNGLASLKWGVEYCVIGHDYERAHGASCRSLRVPF